MTQKTHSTADCKLFLTQEIPGTQIGGWKRISKQKAPDGRTERVFSYTDGREVLVKESTHGLVILRDSAQPHSMSHILDTVPLGQLMMGGGTAQANATDTVEQKFLRVLDNGIDWMAPEYERSTFDFSKQINFDTFVGAVPDLYDRYIAYTQYVAENSWEMPEGIASQGYDDSITDVASVLAHIQQTYTHLGLPVQVDPQQLKSTLATLEALKEGVEHEVEDLPATIKAIDHLIGLVWKAAPAARAKPSTP